MPRVNQKVLNEYYGRDVTRVDRNDDVESVNHSFDDSLESFESMNEEDKPKNSKFMKKFQKAIQIRVARLKEENDRKVRNEEGKQM